MNMSNNYIDIQIIEDEDDDTKIDINYQNLNNTSVEKHKKQSTTNILQKYYEQNSIYEIGVDEVGRGPLFGRVYSAAVILPKDDSFDHLKMKDSKKFHSKKKIQDVAEYIKTHAIAWSINYADEKIIDDINILQATQQTMHKNILDIMKKTQQNEYTLLIDGNYFKNLNAPNNITYKCICIEGGDNHYSAIAAASIIAKVERDKYIEELCIQYPYLIDNYCIDSNKGYGAKKHMEGIKMYGITQWHRKTFGICKSFV
jgi:ribonuclease HII